MINKIEPITKLKQNKTAQLIAELYWDYYKLSSSGQETLDKLARMWGVPTEKDMQKADSHIDDLPSDTERNDGKV
tara:strand:- start:701 stop:925 length:225 start_codon:yes stop_codon:yes gene_type:complete